MYSGPRNFTNNQSATIALRDLTNTTGTVDRAAQFGVDGSSRLSGYVCLPLDDANTPVGNESDINFNNNNVASNKIHLLGIKYHFWLRPGTIGTDNETHTVRMIWGWFDTVPATNDNSALVTSEAMPEPKGLYTTANGPISGSSGINNVVWPWVVNRSDNNVQMRARYKILGNKVFKVNRMSSVQTEEEGHREVMGEINWPGKSLISWVQQGTDNYLTHSINSVTGSTTNYIPETRFARPFVMAYTDIDQEDDMTGNKSAATIQHEYRVYWKNILN